MLVGRRPGSKPDDLLVSGGQQVQLRVEIGVAQDAVGKDRLVQAIIWQTAGQQSDDRRSIPLFVGPNHHRHHTPCLAA